MSAKSLVDNWTLQNAGELLHGQRWGESAHELDVSASTEAPHYQEISQDVIALTCLCQTIQHIVLSDELVVDAAFSSSWMDLSSVASLHAKGLLQGREFADFSTDWLPRREPRTWHPSREGTTLLRSIAG